MDARVFRGRGGIGCSRAMLQGVVIVLLSCIQAQAQESGGQETVRGTITGRVTEAGTQRPIEGAYVAVDATGDSGGSNLEGHRANGIYVTGESDKEGRFTLEGVAVGQALPFMVTHPRYIRYAQDITLDKSALELPLDVELSLAGTIAGTVLDRKGKPVQRADVRVCAEDGRLFWLDREDWPVFPYKTVMTDADGRFSINSLDTGQFALDVLLSSRRGSGIGTYFGHVERAGVTRGETASVTVRPAARKGAIAVSGPVPESNSPYPGLGVLSRSRFRTELCGGPFHPEDIRLGEIQGGGLMMVQADKDGRVRFEGLPAGDYSVYLLCIFPVGRDTASGVVFVSGWPVELRRDETAEIRLTPAWTEIGEARPNFCVALNKEIAMSPFEGPLGDLCASLTAALPQDYGVKVESDPQIANEPISLPGKTAPLWQVLVDVRRSRDWLVQLDTWTIRIHP